MAQEVIDNTMAARLEVRGNDDPDVRPYVHRCNTTLVTVRPSREQAALRADLLSILRSVVSQLHANGVRGRWTERRNVTQQSLTHMLHHQAK